MFMREQHAVGRVHSGVQEKETNRLDCMLQWKDTKHNHLVNQGTHSPTLTSNTTDSGIFISIATLLGKDTS